MFPDQQNPSGTPQPSQPQQPNYGVSSAPVTSANGQYEVVPPLPVGNNAGHSGHNPYEFIVNPNTARKSGGLFGGDKFLQKIAILVGGAILLMVIAGTLISAFGPKQNSSATLSAVAAQQQEIIRVATLGAGQASSAAAKNLATNVEVSVASNQTKVIAYLASKGTKLGTKQLALDQNAKTDATLANATATSTYDTAIEQILTNQLTSYSQTLRTAYGQSKNVAAKKILSDSYSSAATLLKQAQAAANTPATP